MDGPALRDARRLRGMDRASHHPRRTAYQADVTYVPVSEVGFDVLRDRVCTSVADLVVPEPDVILVDEADSVLVDEARVPLILAGSAEQEDTGETIARVVRKLRLGEH